MTTTAPAAPSRAQHEARRRSWGIGTTETVLLALSVTAIVVMAISTSGNLLEPQTIRAVLQYLAVPIVIGLSQMVVLSVGQLNLSVGVLTGLVSMVAAGLMVDASLPALVALPVALAVGLVVGAVNGLLVVLTRINGFIVTLATMSIIAGLRYRIHGTGTYQGFALHLVSFGRASLVGLPVVFLIAVLVALGVAAYFRRTISGRHLLASGGNPLAARLSGISNDRAIVVAHTISGLLAGIAGVLVLILSGSVNASIGDDLLLPSFAAPIIGGVALTGGVVSVLGTCLAALVVRLVDVAQAQYNINPRWVDLVVGAVVLGAVLLSQGRGSRAEDR